MVVPYLKRITTTLFIVLFFEITLGGGGRLTALGPLSLRMVLFALALIVSGVYIFQGKKLHPENRKVLLLFLPVICIGLIVGIARGAATTYWWEDIKPLLYFLIIPFFQFAIEEKSIIAKAAIIIKSSALIQAVVLFVILLLIHTHILPFLEFYKVVSSTEEFFFRGQISFFYKGFLYLCIGFIFIHVTKQKQKKILLLILFIAIILSFTRGFLLALTLTYFTYYFFKASYIKAGTLAALALSVALFGQTIMGFFSQTIDSLKRNEKTVIELQAEKAVFKPNQNLLGNRNFSDSERIKQIREVFQNVTFVSFFIGHGFGNGTPSKPIHMEISYLEIFHKQGIIGLGFWCYLFWSIFQMYKRTAPNGLTDAYFYSVVFVFFQSFTNQFINNPIGLSIVLFTFVSLNRLKETK